MFNLFFPTTTIFFLWLFRAVFEEQPWSLGMIVGELSPDGRQHLRANLKPGGTTRNVTSVPRAQTQRNKEFCKYYRQRETFLNLGARYCGGRILKNFVSCSQQFKMSFDCASSCRQLRFSLHTDCFCTHLSSYTCVV